MHSYTLLVVSISVMCSAKVDAESSKYVGAYYWAGSSKITKFEDLNPKLFTHLYYAFVTVENNASLAIGNESCGFVQPLANLKKINPDLKVLFSVVTKNDSFSKVVADESLRKTFIDNAYKLVKKHNYDGLDFDWEFPLDKDKENFAQLLSEISEEFKKHDYLLTAAVRAIPIYNNSGYIVPELAKYLDLINVMTYDYYGSWSKYTGQNSPLYPLSIDSNYEKKYLNVDASIKNWVEAGAPKSKLNMGLPFYGRTFTLKNESEHGLHAPSSGGGRPVAATYYLILRDFQNYTTEWNEEQKNPYKYLDTQWLAYEDEKSLKEKVKYAVANELAGVFVWHIGADDVQGEFSKKKQVLLQTINDALN